MSVSRCPVCKRWQNNWTSGFADCRNDCKKRGLRPPPRAHRRRRIRFARRIRQNVWGNWNGYIGAQKVVEFGTDGVAAGAWERTGECPRCGAPVKWEERAAYCTACTALWMNYKPAGAA